MSDGTAAANADGVSRNDESRRQLLPFEFVSRVLDLIKYPIDALRIVASRDDLSR